MLGSVFYLIGNQALSNISARYLFFSRSAVPTRYPDDDSRPAAETSDSNNPTNKGNMPNTN